MELFRNLMEYRPVLNFDKQEYRTVTWTSRSLKTEKYRDRYMSFKTRPDDYDKIDILIDYYNELPRMAGKRVDKPYSPLDAWKNVEYMTKLIGEALDKHQGISSHIMREAIWKSGLECNSFKASLASSVYWEFDAKRILDISAGWGDRLLASIAHYADRYLGFDPNLALKSGHDEIIAKFTEHRKLKGNYEVRYSPFEQADLKGELFDLVFTSPPYFDLEQYTELAGQSIISYPDFNDWVVKFLFSSFYKAWDSLIVGGNMVIHINDYYKTHYVEMMVLFVGGWCLNSVFDGVIGSIGESAKARPIWVFYKDRYDNKKNRDYCREELKRNYKDIYELVIKHFPVYSRK
jgi:hypothetical protein